MEVIKDDSNLPVQMATFVRLEEDGVTEQVVELPIDRYFNDGSGAVYWINRGFTPLAEYQAKKHAAQVKAQQEADAKKAEEAAAKKAK
jgi:hypothetical protein